MTMGKVRYAVYVSDDNGWFECCPDYYGVFFADLGGAYDADAPYVGGALIFSSLRAARAAHRHLSRSGDWVAPPEINEAGEESRPTYSIAPFER